MRKRILSAIVSIAMLASLCSAFAIPATAATANVPQWQETGRIMEDLNRGLVVAHVTADNHAWNQNGNVLSWRLFGTEDLTNQAFDIYKNGTKLTTTGAAAATYYYDAGGAANAKYEVVKQGETPKGGEAQVAPMGTNMTAKGDEVTKGNSEINSFMYLDIPISRPDPVTRPKIGGGEQTAYYYSPGDGGANDASVGDLDGDGDYEIVLKWEPNDLKDSAGADFTGRVYLDGYEIDPDSDGSYMWRIDLGPNVTAGQHYTQFIVYDFDGDGKSEIACKTAPGSKDGLGQYVTKVGDSDAIRNMTDADNEKSYLGTGGGSAGKNLGPEYLTVFDGDTGEALATTDFIPLGKSSDWGDSSYNRAERFLAGVAYLDGVHPSIIMCRGYYAKAVIRAYDFTQDDELTLRWEHNGTSWTTDSMYRSGNHSLSIADVDNDGKDEIVYGSAVCDDNGKGMANTKLGHGDALHVTDFNNDGIQEAFSVKEHSEGIKNNAADFRVPGTGENIWGKGAKVDTGRGVMANIDDDYAAAHPDTGLALAWSSSHDNLFDLKGNEVSTKPSAGSRGMTNFLVYWDGDLGREIMDDTIIGKYHVTTDSSGNVTGGYMRRFYADNGSSSGYSLYGGTTNNDSKHVPSLSADIWGDWREEVILPIGKGQNDTPKLRIYTSTLPTDYRLTTLMHDSQYRCAVAWQNVGYNQPPHPSYYIGQVALATDSNGNKLNYLAPAVPFTKVVYPGDIEKVDVTGITLSTDSARVEIGRSEVIQAVIEPFNATKKSVTWTSSNPSVATVANGVVKGVSNGTAVITATTKDGGLTETANVEVYTIPVKGISLSEDVVELGVDYTKQITAVIDPNNASDQSVTWTTGDASIATVSKDGVVKGINYGQTTITATASDDTHKATATVKVKPMETVNINNDDVFTSSTASGTDVFDGKANSASLTLTDSTAVVNEFHKDFDVYDQNTASLSFSFGTGGLRVDGGTSGVVNFTGHEYTFNLQFLDEEENNILTFAEAHTTSTQMTQSKSLNGEFTNVSTDWKKTVDNSNSPFGRSVTTWKVDIDFDYDNDVCYARIAGGNGSGDVYEREFNLEGAHFKTLRYYAYKDQPDATVSTNPKISNLTYSLTKTADGDAELLYERGTELKPWSSADLTDWVQTLPSPKSEGDPTLTYDSDNARFGFSHTNPTKAFEAKKTINGVEKNALVTYDVDWYFGRATGRLSNLEYVQFGSNFRIGYTSGYLTFVSTNGGTPYDGISKDAEDKDVADPSKSIFTGSNTDIMKNVKVVFNPAENKIESFQFGGKDIDVSGYTLPVGTTFDTVSFGFTRLGSVGDTYVIPVGLNKVRVSQFIPETTPAEAKDIAGLTITKVEDKTATVTYMLTDNTATGSAMIIGALYDGGKLVEVKKRRVTDVSTGAGENYELTFDNNVADYDLKVMMWNNMTLAAPLADAVTRPKAN